MSDCMRLGRSLFVRFAIGTALVSCGGQTLPVRTTAATNSRARNPLPGAAGESTWHVAPLEALGLDSLPEQLRNVGIAFPTPIETNPDGSTEWAMGSMRARLRGEHVEWARELTLGSIAETARDGEGGRLIVTHTGNVLHAREWLGALTNLASAGVPMLMGYSSRGRVIAVDHELTFWTGGLDGHFGVLDPPSGGTWVDLAFLTGDVGYGVAEPGALFRTTDAGRHFTRVTPNASVGALYRLIVRDGLVRADGIDGSVAFDAEGHEQAVQTNADPPYDAVAATTLLNDWLRHDPLARPTLAATGTGFEMVDGTLVTVHGGILHRLGRDGHDSTGDAQGATVRSGVVGCRIAPLGSRIVAVCPTDAGITVAHESRPDHWEVLRMLTPNRAVDFGVGDNPSIIFSGPCQGSSNVGRSFCWTDGERWITRPRATARVVALPMGRWALLNDLGSSDPRYSLVSIDGTDDRASDLKFTPRDSFVTYAAPIQGGDLLIVASNGERRLAGTGDPGSTIELRPLPSGARSARFATRTHGVALGETLADVWTTTDAGHTWSSMELPFDGNGRDVDLEDGVRADEVNATCWTRGCAIGGLVLWADGVPAGIRAIGAPRSTNAQPTEHLNETIFRPFTVHASCDAPSDHRVAETAQPSGPSSHRGYGVEGWAQVVDAHTESGGEVAVRLQWHGEDSRGQYLATSTIANWPSPGGSGILDLETEIVEPLFMDRTRVVAERCNSTDGNDGGCDALVVAHAAHPATVLPLASILGLTHEARLEGKVRAAIVAADGSVVVQVSLDVQLQAARDVLLNIDAQDHVTTLAQFTWDARRPQRLLARLGNRVGIAAFRRQDHEHFTFHPATGDLTPVERLWHSTGAQRACAPGIRPESPDAIEMLTDGMALTARFSLRSNNREFAGFPYLQMIAEPDGAICTRQIGLSAGYWVNENDHADAPRWLRLTAAPDGLVRGPTLTHDGQRAGSCELGDAH